MAASPARSLTVAEAGGELLEEQAICERRRPGDTAISLVVLGNTATRRHTAQAKDHSQRTMAAPSPIVDSMGDLPATPDGRLVSTSWCGWVR